MKGKKKVTQASLAVANSVTPDTPFRLPRGTRYTNVFVDKAFIRKTVLI